MAEAVHTQSDGDQFNSNQASPSSRFQLPWQDKLHEAKRYKQVGNEQYKAGNIKKAIGSYHRGLLYLRGISKSQEDVPFLERKKKSDIPIETQEEIVQLSTQCYNNLSACLLQTDNPSYEKVKNYCDNVLKVSPDNVKALYRRGVAAYYLKCPDDALVYLKHASNEPDGRKDPNIKKYIQLCEKAITEQEQQVKNVCKAMFSS